MPDRPYVRFLRFSFDTADGGAVGILVHSPKTGWRTVDGRYELLDSPGAAQIDVRWHRLCQTRTRNWTCRELHIDASISTVDLSDGEALWNAGHRPRARHRKEPQS